MTLFLLATVGVTTRRFVDIGAGDGVFASNTANLALNLGFHGLLLDADAELLARGRRYYARHPDTMLRPPPTVAAHVTPDNVNSIVAGAELRGRGRPALGGHRRKRLLDLGGAHRASRRESC